MRSAVKQPSPESCVSVRNAALTLFRGGPSGETTVRFELPKFEVKLGEQIALTGPSGCGKSTLLHLIAGLRRVEQGTVQVCGKDLRTLSENQKDAWRGEKVGFIFQTYQLLRDLSVLENILVATQFSRPKRDRITAEKRAYELLETVGLGEAPHRSVLSLSVGQQQRVAIARALINEPPLVLADEPTGALDPQTASEVFELLRDVTAQQASSLVVVTHDLALAEQLPRRFDASSLLTTHAVSKEARR